MKTKIKFLSIVLLGGLLLFACVPPVPEPTETPAPSDTPAPTATLEPPSTIAPISTTEPTLTTIPKPAIDMIEPFEGAKVEHAQMVNGTSEYLPANSVIWIVVYIPSLDRYYPHKSSVQMEVGGKWASSTYIGQPDEVGLKVDLIVVLANQETQQEFKAYITASEENERYEGLAQLPSGAMIYERIAFERK